MSTRIKEYIIDVEESVYKACWKLYRNNRILVVVSNDRYLGVVTFREMKYSFLYPEKTLNEIVNKKGKIIGPQDMYDKAKIIFADNPEINDIPVVNDKGFVLDIVSRERVFWKQYYKRGILPRMEYAYCIYNAAYEAKALGYNSISVIEFGVAGGMGLLNCEFHAKEIEKIFNIKIEIYGFDSGEGLPDDNMGYKDMLNIWPNGSYKMDQEKLNNRLEKAKLIIGRIEDTAERFLHHQNHAPIGCMLIDVDRYSSTLPILNMLEKENELFLPRIHMYFDDIVEGYDFQGESLAIREFNQRNTLIKISPERGYIQPEYKRKIKICHRFSHEKYNDQTMMFDGWEISKDDLEIPLSSFSL